MAEVVLDLSSLLIVSTVPVVSAVDLGGLQRLLQQLLQDQKDLRDSKDQLQRQQADIDALKAAQAELAGAAGTTSTPATDPAAAALERMQDQLAALDQRLTDLEARRPEQLTPADPSTAATASTAPPAAAEASTQGPPGDDAGPQQQQPAGDHLTELRQQQAQLAQQLADVAAAHKGLQQQVASLQDSKADRGVVRDMLAEGLASKADAAALNLLKAQLGDKADRSELDALMDAMAGNSSNDQTAAGGPSSWDADASDSPRLAAGTGATPAGPAEEGADTAATAAPAVQPGSEGDASSSISTAQKQQQQPTGESAGAGSGAGSRRGTREQGAGGDLAQQLSKLQLQLAVLQDRVNKKADGNTVAELSDSLSATNGHVTDLSDALDGLRQQLAAAVAAAPAPAQSAPAGPTPATGGACDPSTARQLQDQLAALAAKLAAVEAALAGLQATAAGATQQQVPRRVSGEQPASGRLVQALAAQLGDLSAKVARLLSAQGGVGSNTDSSGSGGNGSSAGPSDPSSPAEGAGAGAAAGVTDSSGATSADGSAPLVAAAEAPGGGFGAVGAFGAELAAELDGRMSDLEALVQDLSALKADAAGLQELRALLADTATQADTDQLRQRLASQQSLLDRLPRQVSSLGSSSHSHSHSGSNGGGGSSRPQSAARGSRSHSSSGAAGAAASVSPEYSFLGGGGAGMTAAACAHDAYAAGAGASTAQAGAAGGSYWGADGAEGVGVGGVADADTEGGAMLLRGLQAQLQSHQTSLEQLAEAVSLLATGQAAAPTAGAAAMGGAYGSAAEGAAAGARGALGTLQVGTDHADAVDLAPGRFNGGGEGWGSVPETPNLRFAAAKTAAAPGNGTAGQAAEAGLGAVRPGAALDRSPLGSRLGGLQAAGTGGGMMADGQWGRQAGPSQQPMAAAALAAMGEPGPQVARLKRLLQTGQVGRKMDWFDPTLLQKMAQRLAAIDALLRNGAGAGSGAGAASGDLETKLRRLSADVRLLKDRLGELGAAAAAGGGQGGLRALGQASDGDHSMLSGKPLGGYRCMACDRPLAALDSRPGPYLPSGQLPVSLVSGAEVAAGAAATLGKLPPASVGSRRATAEVSPGSQPLDPLAASSSPDSSRRLVGPQNWYRDVHGLPAEQLPKADVGPTLPAGGWRGVQSLTGEAGAGLPLVRGGSTASGSGATPRTAGGSDRGGVSGGGAR